jgi:hypothetical protein
MKKIHRIATFAVVLFCSAQPLYAAGNAAVQCIDLNRDERGVVTLHNVCAYAVEVAWCVVNYDCSHGGWGVTNLKSFKPGDQWGASGSKGKDVIAFACDEPTSYIKQHGPNQYSCED